MSVKCEPMKLIAKKIIEDLQDLGLGKQVVDLNLQAQSLQKLREKY